MGKRFSGSEKCLGGRHVDKALDGFAGQGRELGFEVSNMAETTNITYDYECSPAN